MLIPKYWAAARLRVTRADGTSRLVSRYGWSQESVGAARIHALVRAEETERALLDGECLERVRDRREDYVEGVSPIREEILATGAYGVITRNAYGAECLNTPDVFFADVDAPEPAPKPGFLRRLFGAKPACVTVTPESLAAEITARFSARSDVRLRLYATPAGLRVAAEHSRLLPDSEETHALFDVLGADPRYVRLCRVQRCFRARLTAKPWRCGWRGPSRQRVPDEQGGSVPAPDTSWLSGYEMRAAGFAACRFLGVLGTAEPDPDLSRVLDEHDRRSGATSSLPLA